MVINKELPAPSAKEIANFLERVDFKLPVGFIEFMKETNGADITKEDSYTIIWGLNDLFELNEDYEVESFAPEFFLFGSDGGDTAYAIERKSGKIFSLSFIGMSKDESTFLSNTFDEFLA